MAGLETLAQDCNTTTSAASDALAWFAANAACVGADLSSLNREFRRHVVAGRKLEAAVSRPMCAGVFGISQAGKSFLISALARKGTQPLLADFGHPIDFLKEINPEAKKESTGVVTRFTLRRPSTPDGFPVALRLLTQTDIVKILGNTFHLDGQNVAEEGLGQAQLAEIIQASERAAGPSPVDSLSAEDIWDIQEYFQSRLKTPELVRQLGEDYWDRLADLAPRLPIRARAELLAPLWNRVGSFTALYVRLAEALRSLDFSSDAFCGLDALSPKEQSVVNVATLDRLGVDDSTRLEVRCRNGARTHMSRSELTALIAELEITLLEEPWPFFRHTDLLDFPGARSRLDDVIRARLEKTPAALAEFFLRGKVAYLFDRYCAEREMTSMLLCLGPSNNEVATMNKLVGDWITSSHGRDAAQREQQQTALFVVMTKFDTIFEETAGSAASSDSLWTGRMNASLLLPFGKDVDGWVQEWLPGRPFDNCFWVRNPNFFAKHLLDYNGVAEVGIRHSEAGRVATYRAESVANALVCRHFRDPGKAFDEAMLLNDGGIRYLAEALEPVCNPAIKLRQIAGQLTHLRQNMYSRLSRFHVTSDLEKLLVQRRTEADAVVEALLDCMDWQRFGLLQTRLHMAHSHLADVWYRVSPVGSRAEGAPPSRPASIGPVTNRSRMRAALFGDTTTPAPAAPPLAAPADRADRFACAAVEAWIQQMRRIAASAESQFYFQLPGQRFTSLVDELVASATRLRLRQRLAEQVRQATTFIEHHDVAVGRPVTVGRRLINDHINYLGYLDLPATEREFGKGAQRHPLFGARHRGGGPIILGEQPQPYSETYLTDWLTGYRDMVDRNVRSGADGSLIDIDSNNAMGEILQRLEGRSKA